MGRWRSTLLLVEGHLVGLCWSGGGSRSTPLGSRKTWPGLQRLGPDHAGPYTRQASPCDNTNCQDHGM